MPNRANLFRACVVCCLAVTFPLDNPGQAQPTETAPATISYASASELNTILTELQEASQRTQGDLENLRIEKWKADGATKRDAQSNVDSIRRNLQTALPEIVTQVKNAPEDIAASFKLYRNLDALYDVFGTVAESAGAFGSKDEFQSLSNDLSALQNARHAFGDRLQNLAANKESEISRLRNQVKTLQAAIPPAPPKKIIVDDTEPPKKPAKKKTTKPAAQTPSTATTPPPK